jgi:hypothetical protein
MKCTTLLMAVGRGPKQPLATVDEHSENGDSILAAAEVSALSDQIKAGVDPARVVFTREERTDAEDTQPQPKATETPAKRRR